MYWLKQQTHLNWGDEQSATNSEDVSGCSSFLKNFFNSLIFCGSVIQTRDRGL